MLLLFTHNKHSTVEIKINNKELVQAIPTNKTEVLEMKRQRFRLIKITTTKTFTASFSHDLLLRAKLEQKKRKLHVG